MIVNALNICQFCGQLALYLPEFWASLSYEYPTKLADHHSSKEWSWTLKKPSWLIGGPHKPIPTNPHLKTFMTDRGPPSLVISFSSNRWFCPQLISLRPGRWCFPPAGCILPETEARCSHMPRMERDLDPYGSPTKLLVHMDQQIICSYFFRCYHPWTDHKHAGGCSATRPELSYDGRSWTTPQSRLRECRNAAIFGCFSWWHVSIHPYPARWMWEMIQSELSQDKRRSLSGPFNQLIFAEKWHSTIDEQFGQQLSSS